MCAKNNDHSTLKSPCEPSTKTKGKESILINFKDNSDETQTMTLNTYYLNSLNKQLCVAEISKVQDDEVGDGTTSVTVLACELLRVSACIFYLMLVF